MKILLKLSLLMFVLSACGPLIPQPSESAAILEVDEHQDFAYDIVWSQDDSMLALTTGTGLYVYDAETYRQLFAFDEIGGSTAVFGKKYFAAVNHKGLYVWALENFELIFHVKAKEGDFFNIVALSPDDGMLAMGETHGIHLWSLPDGEEIATLPNEVPLSDIVFKDKNHLLTANTYFNKIQEWDINNKKGIDLFTFPQNTISLMFSPDTTLVLADYGSTGFQLWDVRTAKIFQNYGDITSVSGWQRLSQDNQYAVVWGYSSDGTNSDMSVWDLNIHLQVQNFKTAFVNGDGWRCGSLNADGSILAASNNEGYVYFYKVKTGEQVGEIFLPYTFK